MSLPGIAQDGGAPPCPPDSPEKARAKGALVRLASHPGVVLGTVVAAVLVGRVAPQLALRLGVIGQIYIDLLKMVALPFMVVAVVFSLRKLLADRSSATILPQLLVSFAATLLLAALGGLLAGLLVGPGRQLAPDTLLAMGQMSGKGALGGRADTLALFGHGVGDPAQGLGAFLQSLIPGNVFASLSQGETLKVMAFSLLFGLAAGRSRARGADSLAGVLETIYRACLCLTQWFNGFLPLVLFAIIASQIARTGLEPLRAMVKFLAALALGSTLLVAASLAALRLVTRRAWPEVLRSQRDPMLMAIATRASAACMPTMITSLVESLGFQRSRIELLVPLGISLLRAGQAFYFVLATLFLAQLYDVHLGPVQLGVVVLGSILAGMASAGMSGVLAISLTGLVCAHLRVPFEAALALFVAVDPVCDMFRTLVGVMGNTAFAAVVAGRPAELEG